ncbi:UNVERIFIED_CONTAM: hypothetical protein FKN15_007192 [Acipenser sinensis]
MQVEKRLELVKQVTHSTHKKLTACLQGQQGVDVDKRTVRAPSKKLPLMTLAQCLVEGAAVLGDESLLGWQQSSKSSGMASNLQSSGAKADALREEMEEAANRVDICRDQLSADMYNFVAKEIDYASYFQTLIEVQADYHSKSLALLQSILPQIKAHQEAWIEKPSYGKALEEHLAISGREIAFPIEACVTMLLECGMQEEGLFRVAPSASKLKKLKASLDCGVLDVQEYSADPHAIAAQTMCLPIGRIPVTPILPQRMTGPHHLTPPPTPLPPAAPTPLDPVTLGSSLHRWTGYSPSLPPPSPSPQQLDINSNPKPSFLHLPKQNSLTDAPHAAPETNVSPLYIKTPLVLTKQDPLFGTPPNLPMSASPQWVSCTCTRERGTKLTR